MSAVLTCPSRRPPREPRSVGRICERCGAAVLGPLVVVEVSHISSQAPAMERHLLCTDCGDSVRAFLVRRRETTLGELVTVTR